MTRRALAALLAVLLLLPPALLVLLALARRWSWPAILPGILEPRPWQDFVTDWSELGAVAARSLAMGIGVALLASTAGFLTSRSVADHPRPDRLLLLLNLPFAVSPVVLGVSLLYALLRLNLAGHIAGVMLAQLILAYAYAVILLSGFWSLEVRSLGELAATLGAHPRQVWLRVFLPLARPLLLVCLFQTFLISWFDYALTLLIGDSRVTTLTVALYQYFTAGDLRLAARCGLLLMVPPLMALLVNQRLLSTTLATRLEAQHD